MKKIVEGFKVPLRLIRNRIIIILYYICRIFPVNNKKIIICNYYGKGYGDNAKYIVKEIIEKELDCDIVWLCKNLTDSMPKAVRKVKYNSISAIYEMVTAKVWIDNCRKPSFIRKRKSQFYIQTWHGGIALKRIEKDVETKLSNSYVENAKHDSMMANLFISNSKFCTELYRSAFWCESEILQCGSPRCDILINKNSETDEKVKRYFNINIDTHILVYAPTFRADLNTNVYDVDFDRLIKVLEQKFGGKWNILVRLHPNISSKSNFIKYTSTIINATNYADMYELLSASDILVTDYSSTMFEFSLTNKPVILYAPDIKTYAEDRNFYFDIRSLPYPLAEDNHQLFDCLEQFDLNNYVKEKNNFLLKLGVMENGDASSKVVEKIKQIME